MHPRTYLNFFKMDKAGEGGSSGGSSSGGAQNGTGGAGSGNSGEGNNQGGSGGAGDPPKVIKPEDHDRALADLHKFKSESKKAADALAAVQAELDQMKKGQLKSAADLKPYVEQLEKETKAKDEQIATLKKGFGNTFKEMEVKAACQALGITEQGMKDLALLSFEEVNVEFTTEGRVIVSGAKEAAENLKRTRGHWFTSGAAANINTGGKGGSPTPDVLTTQYMNELETKDPKKYRELFPKFAKQLAARKQ